MIRVKNLKKGIVTLILFILSWHTDGNTLRTISDGSWTDISIWNTNAIPSSTDSIFIYHKITVNFLLTLSFPGTLILEKDAILCADKGVNIQSGLILELNYATLKVDTFFGRGTVKFHYGVLHTRKGVRITFNIFTKGFGSIKVGPDFSCFPPIAKFETQENEVCQGNCMNFMDGSLNLPENWKWSFPGGNPSSDTLQNPTEICYYSPGRYEVKLTVSSPMGSDSLIKKEYILVKPNPTAWTGSDTSICHGDTILLNSHSDLSCKWSPPTDLECVDCSEPLAFPTRDITYHLTITDTNNCTDTDSIFIKVLSPPNVDLGNNSVSCLGDTITLNTGSSNENYEWSTGENTPIIKTNAPGLYWVIVTNQCGSDTDSVSLKLIEEKDYTFQIPNVFTPNGDGYNDKFYIKGLEVSEQSEILIFDRWGINLFNSNSIHFEWEGVSDGKTLPEGVYFYLLKTQNCRKEKIEKNGTITILR